MQDRANISLVRAAVAACACALALSCGGSQPAPRSAATPSDEATLQKTLETFYWQQIGSDPPHGVRLGYHQYDGKLPDITPEAIAADERRLRQAKRAFEAIDPGALSQTAWLERQAVLYAIAGELWPHEQRLPFRDPQSYAGALALTTYISRPYAEVDQRAQGIIAIAKATPAYLAQANRNLEASVPKPWLETAIKQVAGMTDFVRNQVASALTGLTPERDAELRAALVVMADALQTFGDALVARMPQANDKFALGEAAFLRLLRETQGVDVSIAELERIAKVDLTRNLEALQAAARAIDKEREVREVVQSVIADKPAASEVLAVATEQSARARQFLVDNEFVSIPSDLVTEVRETPPFMRFNMAFLDGSGPFEKKKLPSFYYITPPDPSWPAEKQQQYVPDRASLAATTVHEVWPGHFLQALHMRALKSRTLRTFRNYATTEGWAHYAEELMQEQGFDAGTRYQVGQLLMALLRNVRFVVTIGLHTRGMTVEQAAELFRTQAYQDEGNAQQQAVRGTFDPMYLSYTLGKLMIMKLRADYRAQREAEGQPFSLREFHDRFLSYGAAPVPVIRRAMLGARGGSPL